MPDTPTLKQSAPNWRQTIKRNRRRTGAVMLTYVFIYILIGLLFDLYIQSKHHPGISTVVALSQLIRFHWTPYVTLLTLSIAIISLLITLAFSDHLMLLGTQYHQIIAGETKDPEEIQLYNVVEEMKISAGMKFMPKVYLIDANYMNAFASGWSEKSAMVAITTGLMKKLTRSELQAVMAHELTHIRHQDIKLTLCASVLSQLILMIIDVLFYTTLFGSDRRDENTKNGGLFIVVMIIRFALPLITVLLMLYLSRKREFMADAGAVELMRDNLPMASALCKIAKDHEDNQDQYQRDYQQTGHEQVRRQAYIFDPSCAGIKSITGFTDALSTHPSIKKRLEALGFLAK
jgi:heat shock protein HtpX